MSRDDSPVGGTKHDRPDPTEDPNACSRCGVYTGSFSDEYCNPCARELGTKPPIQQCMGCGREASQELMEPIDVSPPDEYYPKMEYLCRDCSGGEDGA